MAGWATADMLMTNHLHMLERPHAGLVMGYCGAARDCAGWLNMPYVCCMRQKTRRAMAENSPKTLTTTTHRGLAEYVFPRDHAAVLTVCSLGSIDVCVRKRSAVATSRLDHGPKIYTG